MTFDEFKELQRSVERERAKQAKLNAEIEVLEDQFREAWGIEFDAADGLIDKWEKGADDAETKLEKQIEKFRIQWGKRLEKITEENW